MLMILGDSESRSCVCVCVFYCLYRLVLTLTIVSEVCLLFLQLEKLLMISERLCLFEYNDNDVVMFGQY